MFAWIFYTTLLFATPEKKSWEKIHQEAGITIYSRTKPGTNYYKYRGVGVVYQEPSKVFTIIQDAKLVTEWVSGTKNIKLLQKNYDAASYGRDPREFIQVIYGQSIAPWPFQDRDYYLQGRVDLQNKSATIKLNDIKASSYPPREGLTRMRYMNIEFKLTPVKGGKHCLLDFTLDVHPGGIIPFFVVNHLAKKETIRTLKNLRKLTSRSDYDKGVEKLVLHYWKY